MKVVSIREFTRNTYKYLDGEDLTVTKNGRHYFTVSYVTTNVATKSANVATKSGLCSDNLCHDTGNNVTTINDKDSIKKYLQVKTAETIDVATPVKPEWCLPCQKVRKFVQAVKQVEVVADDGWHEVWMCERCARKNGSA